MPNPPQILALDIGNTMTKVALFSEGQQAALETFPTETETPTLLQEELQALVTHTGSHTTTLDGIVVSSVVPVLTPMLKTILQQTVSPERLLWLDQETPLQNLNLGGLDISHYNTSQLGTDRLALMIGCRQSYPEQKCLVASFGTAATFDLVDESGCYLGGAIAPGPRKFQSLLDSAHMAQLFEVDVFTPPTQSPGLTTAQCLANGTHYGYKGVILEVLGNLLQNAQWPLSQATLIFSGGDAYNARQMVTLEIPRAHVEPHLGLHGLATLWQLNASSLPVG